MADKKRNSIIKVKFGAIQLSPPFEGGVAGTIDYLIVADLFPGRGG